MFAIDCIQLKGTPSPEGICYVTVLSQTRYLTGIHSEKHILLLVLPIIMSYLLPGQRATRTNNNFGHKDKERSLVVKSDLSDQINPIDLRERDER